MNLYVAFWNLVGNQGEEAWGRHVGDGKVHQGWGETCQRREEGEDRCSLVTCPVQYVYIKTQVLAFLPLCDQTYLAMATPRADETMTKPRMFGSNEKPSEKVTLPSTASTWVRNRLKGAVKTLSGARLKARSCIAKEKGRCETTSSGWVLVMDDVKMCSLFGMTKWKIRIPLDSIIKLKAP